MCARNKNYLSEPTKRPCNNRDHTLSWQTNYCFWFLSSSSVCLYVGKLSYANFSSFPRTKRQVKFAGADLQLEPILVKLQELIRNLNDLDQFIILILLYIISKIYNKNTVNIKGELIFKWNYFLMGFGLEALEKER